MFRIESCAKGCLLRFESNSDSTATSDGGEQKLRNDVWHDSESMATKVCSQIGRIWNVTFESHIVTSQVQPWRDGLRFSIWRLFEQSALALVNNHLLCYWPTIHNLILKICPKIQVLSFYFFEVNKLLNVHWAKYVLSEKISTPIYVECCKIY